jgi:hypothetical protein
MAATMDDCWRIAESLPAPSGETALTGSVTPLLASGFCHSLRDYLHLCRLTSSAALRGPQADAARMF